MLYTAGDPVTDVYIVASGKLCLLEPSKIDLRVERGVQVQYKLPSVELEIVPVLGLVGVMGLLQRKATYLHTAVAIGTTQLWVCTSHVFQRLFGRMTKKVSRVKRCSLLRSRDYMAVGVRVPYSLLLLAVATALALRIAQQARKAMKRPS